MIMTESGWLPPVEHVDAGTARRGILWQHERIRAQLGRACAVADAALEGEATSACAVASTIGDLHATLEVHLSFEEAVLLPLWRGGPPEGPDRVRHLLDEHGRQRHMLEQLHEEARAHPLLPTLAAKLAALTSWLLADMAEEERTLPAI
jgi:iron-sulfur cluster repair protein YtfE (RIC family)